MNLAPPQSDLVVVSAAVATAIWLVLAGFSRDLGEPKGPPVEGSCMSSVSQLYMSLTAVVIATAVSTLVAFWHGDL